MYHIVGHHAGSADNGSRLRREQNPPRSSGTERRSGDETYDNLNSKAKDRDVDYVMLGCPHYSLEQIQKRLRLIGWKKSRPPTRSCGCSHRVQSRPAADAQGLTKRLRDGRRGVGYGYLFRRLRRPVPPGTKVAALDSAKQTHYLPAIMNIQAWFGTTQDCINAAVSGRWNGVRP